MRRSFGILSVTLLIATIANAKSPDVARGKILFETRACIGCHTVGSEGTGTAGPNLTGVTKKRKTAWLRNWIKNPDSMRDDPIIKKYSIAYPFPMPAAGLSDAEVADIIVYLSTASKR